jgi:hypothetical protein
MIIAILCASITPIIRKNENVIRLFEKRYARFIEFRKDYDMRKTKIAEDGSTAAIALLAKRV